MFRNVFGGRRVFVTGHTGFKGSWLSLWLTSLGAEVAGYSIGLPSAPSNFELLGLSNSIRHIQGDIRDRDKLAREIDDFRPDLVFHLAAQALVRRSYLDPHETFSTNVMGMVNVLECLRSRPWIDAAVVITSDKVYRNMEWQWGYRENDALGGKDPYSSSKAAADLIAQSYAESYFDGSATRIAIARAGNVIGGGDWAENRIVPDCVRSWVEDKSVVVRSPNATRPWQHVLEPLSGYLALCARLLGEAGGAISGEAFNFGPDARVNQSVGALLDEMVGRWPGARWEREPSPMIAAPEATLLKLSCDKSLHQLSWHSTLTFDETVAFTVDWYRRWAMNGSVLQIAREQVEEYCSLALKRGNQWALP